MDYFNEDKAIEDFFSIVPKIVLKKIIEEFYLKDSFIHGAAHWSRVYHYGHILSELNDFDKENIAFFSIFHDSKRFNDDYDPEHGLRGAEFFKKLSKIIDITNEQKEIIYEACKKHNYQQEADSLEVGLCFDADRLDLWRVGINPNDDYLHIKQSKSFEMKKFTKDMTLNNQFYTKLSTKMIAANYDLKMDKKSVLDLLKKMKGIK